MDLIVATTLKPFNIQSNREKHKLLEEISVLKNKDEQLPDGIDIPTDIKCEMSNEPSFYTHVNMSLHALHARKK